MAMGGMGMGMGMGMYGMPAMGQQMMGAHPQRQQRPPRQHNMHGGHMNGNPVPHGDGSVPQSQQPAPAQ